MPFNFGDESLTSGQPVAIQCMVTSGDLPLKIRWVFHGEELSSQMGISIIKAGPRLSILTIDSIAAGHSGDYTCTASNSAATVNYTATLAVNGLLPEFHFGLEIFSFARNVWSHRLQCLLYHQEIYIVFFLYLFFFFQFHFRTFHFLVYDGSLWFSLFWSW